MMKIFLITIILSLQAGALFARDVDLGSRSREICVGERSRIMQLGQQALWWKINGRGSRLSTWSHRGSYATLTADVDTANVFASCRVRGSEHFDISWMLAYNDPNTYNLRYYISCIPCVDKRSRAALRKAKAKLEKLIKTLDEGELSEYQKEKIVSEIEKAKKKLRKAMENPRLHKLKRIQIQKLIEKLDTLIEEIFEDVDYDRTLDQIEAFLNNLLRKIELTPIIPVPGPTPIRPIVGPVPITPIGDPVPIIR